MSKLHSYCPVDGYVGYRVSSTRDENGKLVEARRKCIDCGADMGDTTALFEPDGPVESGDQFLLVNPRSPAKLAVIRQLSLEHNFEDAACFTCDDCEGAPRCLLAFDFYNTNGDCLASK